MRLTPKNRPNHDVVGRRFRAWDGNVYYCQWYDPTMGYQMIEVDEQNVPVPNGRETNVSERAIGRTFHRVYNKEA